MAQKISDLYESARKRDGSLTLSPERAESLIRYLRAIERFETVAHALYGSMLPLVEFLRQTEAQKQAPKREKKP